MFTGLIREMATVESFSHNTLRLKASYKPKIGDSIAINGACLTATKVGEGFFEVELSKESRDILALENYVGTVHIEPAMQLGERIEGHMIQGHIDAIGTIASIKKNENAWDFYLVLPSSAVPFMMPKGSIAVDGVSLTINEITPQGIRLTIINHTMDQTLFSTYKPKQRVNIETDMFARYIYTMLHAQKSTPLSWRDVDKIQSIF